MNYIMAICKNGHMLDDHLRIGAHHDKYCVECGAEIITQCQNCNTYICGALVGGSSWDETPRPKYCPECGKPYPWTERALASAADLIYETACLEAEECERLISVFPDIASETPNTQLAVARIKRSLAKVGETGAELIKSILVEITCEAVKQYLGWR